MVKIDYDVLMKSIERVRRVKAGETYHEVYKTFENPPYTSEESYDQDVAFIADAYLADLEEGGEPTADPDWYDQAHLPPAPGVYYVETCDGFGNPIPGLGLQEPDNKFAPSVPTKYYGPINGAMEEWPTTAG